MCVFHSQEYVMKKSTKSAKVSAIKAASKKTPTGKSNAKRTSTKTTTSTR